MKRKIPDKIQSFPDMFGVECCLCPLCEWFIAPIYKSGEIECPNEKCKAKFYVEVGK